MDPSTTTTTTTTSTTNLLSKPKPQYEQICIPIPNSYNEYYIRCYECCNKFKIAALSHNLYAREHITIFEVPKYCNKCIRLSQNNELIYETTLIKMRINNYSDLDFI